MPKEPYSLVWLYFTKFVDPIDKKKKMRCKCAKEFGTLCDQVFAHQDVGIASNHIRVVHSEVFAVIKHPNKDKPNKKPKKNKIDPQEQHNQNVALLAAKPTFQIRLFSDPVFQNFCDTLDPEKNFKVYKNLFLYNFYFFRYLNVIRRPFKC